MNEPERVDIPDGVLLTRRGEVPREGWEVTWGLCSAWEKPQHAATQGVKVDEFVLARRKPVTVEVPLDLLKQARRAALACFDYSDSGSGDERIARDAARDLATLIEQAEA